MHSLLNILSAWLLGSHLRVCNLQLLTPVYIDGVPRRLHSRLISLILDSELLKNSREAMPPSIYLGILVCVRHKALDPNWT